MTLKAAHSDTPVEKGSGDFILMRCSRSKVSQQGARFDEQTRRSAVAKIVGLKVLAGEWCTIGVIRFIRCSGALLSWPLRGQTFLEALQAWSGKWESRHQQVQVTSS